MDEHDLPALHRKADSILRRVYSISTRDSNGGFLASVAVLSIFMVGSLRLGPVDATRTFYATVTGDSQVLKRRLMDYSYNHSNDVEVKTYLSNHNTPFAVSGGRVDPQSISTSMLWDLAEKTGPFYQSYTWTFLPK